MLFSATSAAAPAGLVLCCLICPDARAGLYQATPDLGGAGMDADSAQLCRAAIAATERNTRIPDAFLSAMGRIESGRAQGGSLSPWPWTVNAAGTGHFYPSKQAAMDAVRQFEAAGTRSVDVGCLQVNLFYHPDAFANLEQAFDPAANAAYAAKLLLDLFAATGSWPRAAAAYHSMTPALGLAYQQKVLEEWALPDRPGSQAAKETRKAARVHELPAKLPEAASQAPTPAIPAPVRETAAGAAAPALGFNRRFMLPAPRLAAGRNLAAYRAMPVQLAWRLAGPAGSITR